MRVFSIDKYVKEEMRLHDITRDEVYERMKRFSWPLECNGLTEEEMIELGYLTFPEWMVERKDLDKEIKADEQDTIQSLLPDNKEVKDYLDTLSYYETCTNEYNEGFEDGVKWLEEQIIKSYKKREIK